ncbi:ewing's tumor-associated antigen 1 [Mus pahari]|uniref:ewing's tumor-associated antigen 1 n=1 Tax=Mus pahari TaxID=10093 RepID=UPI000A312690|nr:ewing's tumor-associated antigen 1 [Mus pahari]
MRLKVGGTGMSRRRKHADSPARRSTPRRAAADNCCPAAEPWPRGSRAAGDSQLSRAAVRSARRAQRRAAADGGRSPREKETPTQVVKTDLLSCTFSSPNDPDGQTDIFWDQNSPMTKQLGKGRKKQVSSAYSDEISHIVNRIAPQDEKPATNSMLGVWIGETAIPCTPIVVKEKSRMKISCTKLKTKNREKELMKLAQQFDKNMEELDVIQVQDGKNHDFFQMTSEMGHLDNHKDSVQMPSDDVVPEITCTPVKKHVKGDSRISLAKGQDSSQKPFDQNVEAAFNAIFDGSTQMCSGQLSQDLSDAFLNNSKTSLRKKNALLQEEILTTETLLTENLLNKTPISPSPQIDSTIILKSCVTPCPRTPAASDIQLDELTANDFEDDWESLLGSEPFLLENAEMLEFVPSTAAQDTCQKALCTSVGENDTNTSRTNMNLGGTLRDSKVTLDLPSKTRNRELRNAGEYRFSSHPGDESRKVPITGNKVSFEKFVTNKDEDYIALSNFKVKEDCRNKCILKHSSNASSSYTRHPNKQKSEPGVNLPLQLPTTDPFDSVFLGKENIVCNTNQSHGSKFNPSFDDWNDPLLASEMIKACHQLETTWEADDVDDDLLYQACDDIERLTQQDNKGSKESESVSTSKHGSKNTSTASKQGSQSGPSKHWNVVSSAVPLSLANKPQINKPVTVQKRDICRDCPNILDATDLSVCSKNSSDNQHGPVQVNSSKFVLGGSSNLNVSLGPMSTKNATNIKLNTQQLSHNSLADTAQNDNKILKLSKFTFKKKNPQFLSQLNQSHLAGTMPVGKISEDLGKRESVNSLLVIQENQQQASIKYSEFLKPSSPDEEERNRKYSPEEIQRKRQEALVRRKAKALHTLQSAPISLP